MPDKNHIDMVVGRAVRRGRELKGWSETDLATSSGLSKLSIQLVENGFRRLDAIEIPPVVNALEIAVADLFKDSDHEWPVGRKDADA